MQIDSTLTFAHLARPAQNVAALAATKVRLLDQSWDKSLGAPVFTVAGKYASRGWTEWTQGFQFGCALLAFDLTGEADLLELGRRNTVRYMAPHVTHAGVHDHAFNNLSTYGNLRRLMREGRIANNPWELAFYEMAIKSSGAVQAARWSRASDGGGYVYSFNGPHSLFIDTMRTVRILGLAHQLGHVLMGEGDRPINLLNRAVTHAMTTARFLLYKGDTQQTYDVRGRTAHEGIFNVNDGNFRCRSTQQGYSPFSTWTRGLAWAMLGFAEDLEFFAAIGAAGFSGVQIAPHDQVMAQCLESARAVCDHYIDDCSALDGVVYWDDGAPGLAKMPDWRSRAADPFNEHEPVDSSAAAIAAQGLLRLGRYLGAAGQRYTQAGLTIARTIFAEPYLAANPQHQGLLLHSIYHRPNDWDYVPPGRKSPSGESSLWGDYHAIELTLLISRMAADERYHTFFDPPEIENAYSKPLLAAPLAGRVPST